MDGEMDALSDADGDPLDGEVSGSEQNNNKGHRADDIL